MVLADTNLIIYATRPDYAVVANWLLQSAPACSAITRVEALGYHRLSDIEHRAIETIFACLRLIYPTADTFERAIRLRRQRKMSLGDALIAATAMEHGLTLATANTDDFRWIDGLRLVNPVMLNSQ